MIIILYAVRILVLLPPKDIMNRRIISLAIALQL
jgi:hypothetical protein